MNYIFSRMRRLVYLFTIGLCCIFTIESKATHYAAVDMYVDYVGSGPTDLRYKVTLSVYKACENPNGFANADLSIYDGDIEITSSCGSITPPSYRLPVVAVDTLDQLCQNFSLQNSCRSTTTPYPGFVRWRFVDTITLPTVCTDWTFSWSSGSRNGGISNIPTAQNTSIYIECKMNTAARYNNSSPRFLIDPLPYLCVNQPGFYVNGPFDPNLDSLVTENVCPLSTNATACLNYGPNPPYSLANPLNSSSGYTVNPNTGTASFTPTTIGKFVVAFQCNEYDQFTGVALGSIRRDVQLSILGCNAPPPFIDSIPQNPVNAVVDSLNGSYFIKACPGSPISFDVNAASLSGSNSVFLSSNNLTSVPGSVVSFINQGTGNPVAHFDWTPTGADIGNYTIIIFAKDSTCTTVQPILLTNYFVLQIKVLPGVDAGPDGKICGLNGDPFQFNITGPPNVNYYWSGFPLGAPTLGLSNDSIANPTAYPPYNFTYIVSTDDITSNCKRRDTVTVFIDTSNSVVTVPDDILICRPGYLQLDAQGIGLKPLANLSCGTVGTVTNCTNGDSAEVRTQYTGGSVAPSTVFSPFTANHRTARMQFLLRRNDLYAYGLRSGTINKLSFFVTTPGATAIDNFKISIKCTDRTDISPIAGGFEPGTIPVYSATAPVVTQLGWNDFVFDQPYNYDSTQSLIVEICYSNPANGIATEVNSVQTNSPQMIISYSDVGSGNICLNPTIANTIANYTYRPVVKLGYCPAPEAEFEYTWSPGTFLSDSTIKTPLAYISENTTYTVFTRGRNGCLVKDDVTITLPSNNYDVTPRDTSVCIGQSFGLVAAPQNSTVEWFFTNFTDASTTMSCTNCANPLVTPDQSGTYYVVFTDTHGCKDTLDVKVTVRPLPNVRILNQDTTIKYGQSIQLLVAGAYIYNWTPVSTLTNPNIVNPIASPTEPTTYTVFGLADNGCRNLDSVRISIDYRDNLFVPTAFTPNGDGKNDIFRVSNLTFQQLQEFRVFNRWGQELFRTNDPKTGWDGTWRGVQQDMGSYQYLIRVAYPDGFVETYKGDVTLIR